MSLKNCLSDLILIYTLSLNDAGLRLQGERSHLLLFLSPVSFVSIKSIGELNYIYVKAIIDISSGNPTVFINTRTFPT